MTRRCFPLVPPSRLYLAVLAVALVAACQTASGSATKAVPARPIRSLAPPKTLSLTARALLSRRMESHGFEMTNLLWATLMLDRPAAASIARAILDEPRLARPVAKDGSELNAGLPDAFFELQDRFVAAARQLQTAADDADGTPQQLATAFSELTATCVNCHAVYLQGH